MALFASSPRLTVKSSCDFPIWIQQQYGAHGLPIPDNPNAKRLDRGESLTFAIPDAGLAGSRSTSASTDRSNRRQNNTRCV